MTGIPCTFKLLSLRAAEENDGWELSSPSIKGNAKYRGSDVYDIRKDPSNYSVNLCNLSVLVRFIPYLETF